jgi:hypothetical protein
LTKSAPVKDEQGQRLNHPEWHILDPANLKRSLCGRKMTAGAPRRRAPREDATCVVCADLAAGL